jgi:hypothetical protein
MCPTRAQSIQREQATLLSTEYTSRFRMPSIGFRQSAVPANANHALI